MTDFSDPFSRAQAFHAAYEKSKAGYRAQDTYAKLRALYVKGTIECEDFEARLDALLRRDPKALDRKPGPPVKGGLSSAQVAYLQRYGRLAPERTSGRVPS